MFTPIISLVSADARGEIYSIAFAEDQEFLLLHSTAGSVRGGHSHNVDEVVVMLKGSMEYHKRDDTRGTEWHMPLASGQSSFNRADVTHMGEFSEDSWLLEYKVGTKLGEWRNTNYAPWRQRVDSYAASK